MEQKDREILRELAKKQKEIALSPKMQELRDQWRAHNDCKGQRPMVTVELGTFQEEVMEGRLCCEDPQARRLEELLRSNLINYEYFGDDTVVDPFLSTPVRSYFKPFGIDVKIEHSQGLGHHFVPVLHDLEEDYSKLKKSDMGIRDDSQWVNFIEDAVGNILPPKRTGFSLYAVPTQDIVHIMSMEDMYLAMYDSPELFKEMLERLSDDYLEYFKMLEKAGAFRSTVDSEWVGQGTYSFTSDLPAEKEGPFTSKDIWGFMDSQETSGISPEMFREFVFPYYEKISRCYGLLSYGCCEPVNPIWESCLSTLPNLRKVSISPWCDEEYMGQQLSGKKIIYHRKPSPNFLGVGEGLDEEEVRKHIRRTLLAAKGCHIEFTQRDVYTIHHDLNKVRRFVELIRQECENHYCP